MRRCFGSIQASTAVLLGSLLLGWPAAAQLPAGQSTARLPPSPEAATAVRDPRGPSADGYFWFDIEVSVFSSDYGGTAFSERPVASKLNLRFLPQLRLLADPFAVYRFDFAAPQGTADGQTATLPPSSPSAVDQSAALLPGPILERPEPGAAVTSTFRLLDLERDAFIGNAGASTFAPLNSRLQASPGREVLWSKHWRQPLRVRAQSSAVLVTGGDVFGDHHELEGSVRLSGQDREATLDVNLWLTRFAASPSPGPDVWTLPDAPFPESSLPAAGSGARPVTSRWHPQEIWQLTQTLKLAPNSLHYIDHPTIGVIVEIRPYLVPEAVLAPPALPPSGPGFE